MEKQTGLGRKRRLILALYDSKETAQCTVERLIDEDFLMDDISILGPAASHGDDLLGVSYDSAGERIKYWGEHGAFWGAIGGLLAAASGFFLIPGLGAIAAAGPIVEAIVGTLGGAAITGGAMAAAAAISQLAVVLHRLGVPEDRLQHFHDAIRDGQYLVMLRCGVNEAPRWLPELERSGAIEVSDYPYLP